MSAAFPLSWPAGWPRTSAIGRMTGSNFKTKSTRYDASGGTYSQMNEITFDRAMSLLADELERLRATNIIVSTNLPLRADGQPSRSAVTRSMSDPGVAVYFSLKGRPMVMACDRYTYIAANMRSIGLAIEAMRTLERHGGGAMMERAFDGFAALPAPGKIEWRSVLGFRPYDKPTIDDVEANFRKRAKIAHPDVDGGSAAVMSDLNAARDAALKELQF